jgi:cellulose synthase/poly-beta-1,6-N-acetylglucosamine synthase-like glycosyltransferase
MVMFEPTIVILLWLFLLVQLLLFTLLLADDYKNTPLYKNIDLPDIDILIAARNEEAHLINCLNSLLKLNYPINKLNVLIGNDGSTDKTEDILKQFCSKHAHINYVNITQQVGQAKAKANVLAQLVQQTNAPYIFVTDADIIINSNWVLHLLPFLSKNKYGIVSGTTKVNGKTFIQRMQGLEWLMASAQIVGLDRAGIKTTAVGNNMAFTRQAYLATGGYENIPYSVTEDLQLYKYMLKNGFKTINILNKNSLQITVAPPDFKTYLHQRKRWLTGAAGLPWHVKLVLALYAVFLPLIIILLFINIYLALKIWFAKLLVQTITFVYVHKHLNQSFKWFDLLLYEIYTNLNTFVMLGFYIWPVSLKWKGR